MQFQKARSYLNSSKGLIINVKKSLTWLIVIFTFLSYNVSLGQFTIPERPSLKKEQTSVYDYTNLLSTAQKASLEQKLIRYSDSTSTQIVVLIISTTEGEDINYLGAKWGQTWGIGQGQEDNGVVILLAKDDRKIAISTGYGVEEFLTDLMSKRIIETIIIPQFKSANYYGGLDKGADAIFQVLTGQFKEDRDFSNKRMPFDAFLPFIIFFIILIILASRKGRGGGKNNRGGKGGGLNIWDVIILSNMGRGGSSSGGFGGSGSFGGGGGFGGGFGGGGFGGGGASGGW